MSRLPVNAEFLGGKSPRQRIWDAIRAQRSAFTHDSIGRGVAKAARKRMHNDTIRTYLKALERGGYIGQKADAVQIEFELLKDNGVECPRLKSDGTPVTAGLGTEAMWRSMRIISDFDARELAAHASASGQAVEVNAAKDYIKHLHAAGYLKVVKDAVKSGKRSGSSLTRYQLIPGKNTGPRPPMIQRAKTVYDQNLGKVVWQEEPKHEY